MQDNLSLYHIFYTVARTGSISHSSRDLYISQPAISKAIQKLEQNLDTVLFKRSSRGVTLTPDGELLFEKVKKLFHFWMKEKIPFAITVPGTFQSCVWAPVLLLPDMYCSPTWKTILHVFLMYVSQFPASLLIRRCSFWMRKKSIWDSSDGRRSFGDIIFSLF